MTDYVAKAGTALGQLMKQLEDDAAARDALHTHLKETGLLARVTLHKYMCKRGCQIATVFRAGGLTLCAVRDYKFSPGLNERASVPSARERNTLDGDKHWPGHIHDVSHLAGWGPDAGMDMNCRHRRGTVLAVDVLAAVEGVEPGKPGVPTRL